MLKLDDVTLHINMAFRRFELGEIRCIYFPLMSSGHCELLLPCFSYLCWKDILVGVIVLSSCLPLCCLIVLIVSLVHLIVPPSSHFLLPSRYIGESPVLRGVHSSGAFFPPSYAVWCLDKLVYVVHRELLFLDAAALI